MFQQILIESSKRVLDQLEYGHAELAYEKALVCELTARGIRCESEITIPEYYIDSNNKKHYITFLRIDISILKDNNETETIVELKTVKSNLGKDKEYIQALRYKRLAGAENCYLINFGYKRLEVYDCCAEEFKNLCEN